MFKKCLRLSVIILAGLLWLLSSSFGLESGQEGKLKNTGVNEVKKETYAVGQYQESKYHINTANGKVIVLETPHYQTVQAYDETAGFRTKTKRKGSRSVELFITGSKYRSKYEDLDGDGLVDAMWQYQKKDQQWQEVLFILAEGKWVEVRHQSKTSLDIDSTVISVVDPQVRYVFKNAVWIKE